MKKRQKYESYLDLTKRMMNEISSENVIYDEIQTGPQEEATIQEYRFDLEKFKEYKKKMKNTK